MAIPKLKKACIDYVPDLINADHGKLLVQVSRWYDDEDNAVSSRTRAGKTLLNPIKEGNTQIIEEKVFQNSPEVKNNAKKWQRCKTCPGRRGP